MTVSNESQKPMPKPMSDEFWMSLGFLCGAAFAQSQFGREQQSVAQRHVERVMLELLDRFPEEMWPLKRYVE